MNMAQASPLTPARVLPTPPIGKKDLKMKKMLLVFLFTLLVAQNAHSASTLIINGLPIVKVMSDIGGTESVNLSQDKQRSYRLMITKKGNKYIWTSRENKVLLFNRNGAFYNFIEPNGAGYIRIAITEEGVLYMEHLTLGFKNITYWGKAEEFNIE